VRNGYLAASVYFFVYNDVACIDNRIQLRMPKVGKIYGISLTNKSHLISSLKQEILIVSRFFWFKSMISSERFVYVFNVWIWAKYEFHIIKLYGNNTNVKSSLKNKIPFFEIKHKIRQFNLHVKVCMPSVKYLCNLENKYPWNTATGCFCETSGLYFETLWCVFQSQHWWSECSSLRKGSW